MTKVINKKFLVTASSIALALILAGCGGGSKDSATTATAEESLVDTQEEVAQVTGGFDSPVVAPDGVSYTLSAPSQFTPGKFASGQVPGQRFEKFSVSVSNGSSADLDLATLMVKGSSASGECVDIFDGDSGINGAPQEPLAAGGSITFGWALSCAGAVGDELKVGLSNNQVNIVEVTGKLS